MAKLEAKLFREYFGGSWLAKVTKNGEPQPDIIFNWPLAFEKFSSIGTEEGLVFQSHGGVYDDTKQISMAGWRADSGKWVHVWHNKFGGYGEMHWTSMEVIDGITVIYGAGHECKQETDDVTEHVTKCEMVDLDNFKYTIQSLRKGTTEIVAKRIRTASELKELMKNQIIVDLSISQYKI